MPRGVAAAVNLPAKSGFTTVYSVYDGFEGDKITDTDDPNTDKRLLNGWKNSGAPWTYAVVDSLVPQN